MFWYGADDYSGLAQLIEQRAAQDVVATTRQALDTALADAEAAVGSGPQSTFAVVTNTAILVFREGLEAVLILAALTAGLVGEKRRLRRPLFLGAAGALVATIATFAIAQTVLGSLNRYGEKVEAVVSLVAIAVLLVILNWFYHRVYWGEHLADLHGRKKKLLSGAGLSLAAAQLAGLAMLGFSSVYREGFETTLFLQAIALEAGAGALLEGVAPRPPRCDRDRRPHDHAPEEAPASTNARADGHSHPRRSRDHRRQDRSGLSGCRLVARDPDRWA